MESTRAKPPLRPAQTAFNRTPRLTLQVLHHHTIYYTHHGHNASLHIQRRMAAPIRAPTPSASNNRTFPSPSPALPLQLHHPNTSPHRVASARTNPRTRPASQQNTPSPPLPSSPKSANAPPLPPPPPLKQTQHGHRKPNSSSKPTTRSPE